MRAYWHTYTLFCTLPIGEYVHFFQLKYVVSWRVLVKISAHDTVVFTVEFYSVL